MTSLARTKQRRKPLVLPLILILAGILLLNPMNVFGAGSNRQSNLMYLYPAPQNNPVIPTGMFFTEDPNLGAHSLGQWKVLFSDKQLVVGVPDQFQISQAMLGNNIGNYVLAKINKKVKDKTVETVNRKDNNDKSDPPSGGNKEVIFIERTVGNVTEKVRVEIGEHLRNTDTFEKIYDSLQKGLIPKDTLEKEIDNHKPIPPQPAPKPENAEATTMVFGGTLVLSGMALLAKMLLFAL